MPALQTTAGATHWTQLDGGTTPDNTFGTVIFGRGNDPTDVLDTEAALTSQVAVSVPVSTYVLGDTDPRNGGAGAAIYTWRFDVPAQATPFVASNVALAVTPSTGSGALAIHANDVVWTETARSLVLWFNLAETTASLYTAFEDSPLHAARLRATQGVDLLYSGVGGNMLSPGKVISNVVAGSDAPLRARLYGSDGLPLRQADVRSVAQIIASYEASSGQFQAKSTRWLKDCIVDGARQQTSAVFPYRGGYNFETEVPAEFTRPGADLRVRYELRLCDGSTKTLQQDVRVRA